MINLKLIYVTFSLIIILGCLNCTSKKSNTSYLDVSPDEVSIDQQPEEDNPEVTSESAVIEIPYTEQYGNIITIPIKINGMGLDMIFDTGASDTQITLAEAKYLYEKDNLKPEDLIGLSKYQIANGQIVAGLRVNLENVIIGDKIILHNIQAVVVEDQNSPLLLGQSVMKQFREISVDRENKVVKFIEQIN